MNEYAKKIIDAIKRQYCPDKLETDEEIDQFIVDVYNSAMDDVESFIDVMIEKNPMHRLVLMSLKENMFPGMNLGDETH